MTRSDCDRNFFTAEDLIRSMASTGDVIDAYYHEKEFLTVTTNNISSNSNGTDEVANNDKNDRALFNIQYQDEFARLVEKYWNHQFGPSKLYLCHLVRIFLNKHVGEHRVESDHLWKMMLQTVTSEVTTMSSVPDPNESCYVSFRLGPQRWSTEKSNRDESDEDLLRIRIFPYHNDVALRIWEAGAVLAEYLMEYPSLIRNQKVVELGAGTGITGLVMAGFCAASKVHCTDYSEVSLINLKHNLDINQRWLHYQRSKRHQTHLEDEDHTFPISHGYLEWNAYALWSDVGESLNAMHSWSIVDDADVLVAADVVYDRDELDALVGTFQRFASSGHSLKRKRILLASTSRNQETFEMLMEKLRQNNIIANLAMKGCECASIPCVFPLKFRQHRTDVSIYSLSL